MTFDAAPVSVDECSPTAESGISESGERHTGRLALFLGWVVFRFSLPPG